jgi:hypothetical protein
LRYASRVLRLATTLFVLACLATPVAAQPHCEDPNDRVAAQTAVQQAYTQMRQVAQGSPHPTVELITMGIGSLIWERHGHIALCVVYDSPREDTCYNYGIGDFGHPLKMTMGFFRGTDSFYAGDMDPWSMLATYVCADRTVWVQPLPLTADETQKVIDRLKHDIKPQYRYYAYDHFWDNCTTRVRSVLDEATGGKLSAMTELADGRTYRDLARHGFYGMRVPLLITDLAMGRPTDREPTYYERMFLPDYLREAATKLWHVQPLAIYTRVGPPPLDESPSGRVLFALVILLLTAPAWATRLWGRFQRAGLAFAVIPQWLLGMIFWILAIISPLPYVRWNESCLLFLPLDLALLIGPVAWRRLYARGRVIQLGLFALLLLVGVMKQPLWAAILWPLVPNAVVGFMPPKAKQ